MLNDRIICAARNNARWCDTVCRAHGNPGEFHDDIWLNRHRVPRFYPNAGTLAEPHQQQFELIDELLAARLPSGWAVKDSFCTLDLASRGFRVLFGAQWIYLPVSRTKVIDSSARWAIVLDDLAQAEWESAWGMSTGDTSEDRIFQPSLLDDKNIAMVACYRDGHIVAGAVANRSDGVVGWSNFFAPADEIFDRAKESLATIAAVFPGSPIVGYEHGAELRNAHALGFESLGPLRVWTFQS